MSRFSIAALAAAFVVCLFPHPAGSASAAPSVNSASVQAAIVAAVEKDRKLFGGKSPVPGLLIGVWDSQGNAYVHGFGYADVATKRTMSAADHFRIGSNTKTFVVGVLLQLVDEGKLSLDDPLSRFSLGVTVPNAQNITVRELCDMRSGLFEAYSTPQVNKMTFKVGTTYDPRTFIRWAVEQKPYFAPNKGYKYSNTNYLLLGLIVESLTHDTVGDQITKRIIQPFGLTHTSYPTDEAMPDPWAHGYALDKQKNWEDVSNTVPVSLMGAAGCMISDMADIRTWIIAYVTGKVSKPATYKQLMNAIPTGDGNLSFGLALGESAGWYGYTGGLPGYNTADYYFPANRTFVVAWVPLQSDKPQPGVANTIFHDIAKVMTPNNVPFQMTAGKSGL
jgi:D-alanyl-D-alanine carboxypeptidase